MTYIYIYIYIYIYKDYIDKIIAIIYHPSESIYSIVLLINTRTNTPSSIEKAVYSYIYIYIVLHKRHAF